MHIVFDDILESTPTILSSAADLLPWIDSGGAFPQVEFTGSALADVIIGGLPQSFSASSQSGSVTIEVIYTYSPADTGSGFCFGDGTQGTCPCAALGAPGQGCPNTNPNGNGARLTGAGIASLGNDSFSLGICDAAFNKPGIVFQGSSAAAYPNGVSDLANASGLLCVLPSLRGDAFFTDGAGNASVPNFRGQPFGANALAPGFTTYYQYWFRDPGNSCQNAPATGAAFNFSNAIEVDWTF